MASFNKVILLGNLTRDPELKFIASGTAVCTLGMAVNRKWKSSSGELKEEVCFINAVVWGKSAEACGEHLHKGSSVLVEGHLKLEQWETEDGQKRKAHKVTAERVQFIGGKKTEGQSAAGAVADEETQEDDVPF